jgi:uncharacterized protein YkwD
VALGASLALAGCAGNAPPQKPAAPAAAPAAPAPDAAPRAEQLREDFLASRGGAPTVGARQCGIATSALRFEVLQRVNAVRAQARRCGAFGQFAAVPPLAWSTTLALSAGGHAGDMAARNKLEHRGGDGRDVAQRTTQAGYTWSRVAENIAGGPTSVREVVEGWAASPEHCKNLMDPAVREIGVACVQRAGTVYDTYWAMSLAAPR